MKLVYVGPFPDVIVTAREDIGLEGFQVAKGDPFEVNEEAGRMLLEQVGNYELADGTEIEIDTEIDTDTDDSDQEESI